jgi:hypothetical protein
VAALLVDKDFLQQYLNELLIVCLNMGLSLKPARNQAIGQSFPFKDVG